MATRKGINISEHYVLSTNTICLLIYVLCTVKIVFHIVSRTHRPSDTVFKFRVTLNSSQRL